MIPIVITMKIITIIIIIIIITFFFSSYDWYYRISVCSSWKKAEEVCAAKNGRLLPGTFSGTIQFFLFISLIFFAILLAFTLLPLQPKPSAFVVVIFCGCCSLLWALVMNSFRLVFALRMKMIEYHVFAAMDICDVVVS